MYMHVYKFYCLSLIKGKINKIVVLKNKMKSANKLRFLLKDFR